MYLQGLGAVGLYLAALARSLCLVPKPFDLLWPYTSNSNAVYATMRQPCLHLVDR